MSDVNGAAPGASVGGNGQVQDIGQTYRITPGGATEIEGVQSSSFVDPATLTTPEAWQQAYAEGKLPPPLGTVKAKDANPASDTITPAAGAETLPGAAAPETTTGAAADDKFAPYTAEFSTSGTLSDESVAKAAKDFGVTEDAVRIYVKGLTQSVDQVAAPFHGEFGGAEGFASFQQWAGNGGMDQAAQDSYNSLLASNPAAALQMARAYKGAWQSGGNGPPARDLTQAGAAGAGAGAATYGSWAEVQADMAKPDYKNNPTFRAQVEAKLGASNFS